MNDPKRLTEGSGDRLGASALRAARRDGPSAGSKQRAIAALGLAAATTVAGAASNAAVPFALGRWALSLLGVSAIGAGVIAGGVALTSRDHEAEVARAPAPRASPSSAPVLAPVVAPPERPSSEPVASSVLPLETPSSVPARPARAAAIGVDPPRPALADEVAALDLARRAVAAHDAASALGALDRYALDFPRGFLGQEATVLRIEALVQRGERVAAAELARRFVIAHPTSPMADRARSLGGLPAEEPRGAPGR